MSTDWTPPSINPSPSLRSSIATSSGTGRFSTSTARSTSGTGTCSTTRAATARLVSDSPSYIEVSPPPAKFRPFQDVIFTTIQGIIAQPGISHHDPFVEAWQDYLARGFTHQSTFTATKNILGVKDIVDYKLILQRRPGLSRYVDFAVPNSSSRSSISYRVVGVVDVIAAVSHPPPCDDLSSTTTRNTDLGVNPDETPDPASQPLVPDLELSTTAQHLYDPSTTASSPDEILFEEDIDDTKLPAILSPDTVSVPSSTDRAQTVLHETLSRAHRHMEGVAQNAFPITAEANRVDALRQQINQLDTKLATVTDSFTTRLADADGHLHSIFHRLENKLQSSLTNIVQVTALHKRHLQQATTDFTSVFKTKVDQLSDQRLSHFRSQMEKEVDIYGGRLHHAQEETIELLNDVAKQLQSDLYTTADEVTVTFTQHVQSLHDAQVTPPAIGSPSATAPSNPRWPNVTEETRQQILFGPASSSRSPIAGSEFHYDTLPKYNHSEFMKRTTLGMYNGPDEIFIFYNQLSYAAHQFGVFLHPLDQLRANEPIYPTTLGSYQFLTAEIQRMSFSLYQKLMDPAIIPSSNYFVRNLLNQHAAKHDGYNVLYTMMRQHHPLMKRNAHISPPDISTCHDIYHYATKFDSYITFEPLASRYYHPRQQIVMFVDNLDDEYAPAVTRICQILDQWTDTDDHVPDMIAMEALPSTIAQYLLEHSATSSSSYPTLCYMTGGSRGNAKLRAGDRSPKTASSSTRKSADMFCHACGQWGHGSTNCDKCAAHLLITKFLSTCDDAKKQLIVQNYAKTMKDRKERSLAKNTVRHFTDDNNALDQTALCRYMVDLANGCADVDDQASASGSDASPDSFT